MICEDKCPNFMFTVIFCKVLLTALVLSDYISATPDTHTATGGEDR